MFRCHRIISYARSDILVKFGGGGRMGGIFPAMEREGGGLSMFPREVFGARMSVKEYFSWTCKGIKRHSGIQKEVVIDKLFCLH